MVTVGTIAMRPQAASGLLMEHLVLQNCRPVVRVFSAVQHNELESPRKA